MNHFFSLILKKVKQFRRKPIDNSVTANLRMGVNLISFFGYVTRAVFDR